MSEEIATSETLTPSPKAVGQAPQEILKRFVPLHSLPSKQVKDLAQHAKIIKVKPKSLIFKRGVNLRQRYYLIAGEVDLCDKDFNIKKVRSDAEAPLATALNTSNHKGRLLLLLLME